MAEIKLALWRWLAQSGQWKQKKKKKKLWKKWEKERNGWRWQLRRKLRRMKKKSAKAWNGCETSAGSTKAKHENMKRKSQCKRNENHRRKLSKREEAEKYLMAVRRNAMAENQYSAVSINENNETNNQYNVMSALRGGWSQPAGWSWLAERS